MIHFHLCIVPLVMRHICFLLEPVYGPIYYIGIILMANSSSCIIYIDVYTHTHAHNAQNYAFYVGPLNLATRVQNNF